MRAAEGIRPYRPVVPMVYAYTTPGVAENAGWVKIGYTERQRPEARVEQQVHTAGVRARLEWQDNAMYKDGSGEYFTDRDFHGYLVRRRGVERRPATEWFRTDGAASKGFFDDFARRRQAPAAAPLEPYALREEQEEAVEAARAHFAGGGREFLWNAKPRFGKTLAVYELALRAGFRKVLVLTNRPSVANSWADDFHRFFDGGGRMAFVSENQAVAGKPGVVSRKEFVASEGAEGMCMVAFESLQGLKGSVYFGGAFEKLEWLAKDAGRDPQGRPRHGLEFDLLVLDESQEGVDTMRTDAALRQIARRHTLYLSGTPFRALADGHFAENQIFNWSYADEQARKAEWRGEGFNPYETLPRLALYTYQISPMLRGVLERGADLGGEGTAEWAFDLNEFFATDGNGRFVRAEAVGRWLDSLAEGEKYPFSTPELRAALPHTLWLLNRVASARALARMLREHPAFRDCHVVLAAGDGREDDEAPPGDPAFDRVRAAIAAHPRTITLSVGQLTVGVTVPEWCGVLMLCNLSSPSAYMQAAFRVQNPGTLRGADGRLMRKDTAYVFDFDPARTLAVFDEFANSLRPRGAGGGGTAEGREGNVRRLLNFFPVAGEDPDGRMVELDAAAVLSIPRTIKSREVVRRGFMCNYLFRNIANVFGACADPVREILGKLAAPREQAAPPPALGRIGEVGVDPATGGAAVGRDIVVGTATDLFGPKLYADIGLPDGLPACIAESDSAGARIDAFAESLKASLAGEVVRPIAGRFALKPREGERLGQEVGREVDAAFQAARREYERKTNIAQAALDRERGAAESAAEVQRAEERFRAAREEAWSGLREAVEAKTREIVEHKPLELVERLERRKAEETKRSVEDDVRAHLRGFTRTIPSFLMAYGADPDGGITLATFDAKTEPDVFREVTGISVGEFRFLRDGGDVPDPATGGTRHFAGGLFDEAVFDDAVREFWAKKRALADYFDESLAEDIFDYVPPQKTNQIFTPRAVVRRMADWLEAENPGCFDDPEATFADLYMKSGLYLAEIARRLHRSAGLKRAFPDPGERIRHILSRQLYGLAPTRIIHLIATHYILGFAGAPPAAETHLVQADAAAAAREGRLEALVERSFPGEPCTAATGDGKEGGRGG